MFYCFSSFHLSVWLSVYKFVCLIVSMNVLFLSIFLYLSVRLSVCIFVCLIVSINFYFCLFFSYVFQSAYLSSDCQYKYSILSICLFLLSVPLTVCIFVCFIVSIDFYLCLFVFFFNLSVYIFVVWLSV